MQVKNWWVCTLLVAKGTFDFPYYVIEGQVPNDYVVFVGDIYWCATVGHFVTGDYDTELEAF